MARGMYAVFTLKGDWLDVHIHAYACQNGQHEQTSGLMSSVSKDETGHKS